MTQINQILVAIYSSFPKSIILFLGRAKWLKIIRNKLLRNQNGQSKKAQVKVSKQYRNYNLNFDFIASIRTAAKAKSKGIENTILRNSIKLFEPAENIIIFDIGANFGYLSLVYSGTLALKKGKVFSFEASPIVFKSLKENIEINGLSNIIFPFNYAVNNQDAFLELYLAGSTSNLNSKNILDHEKKIIVEGITLDTFALQNSISNIDLIKIDVDGVEENILQGSKSIINRFKPVIIVETNNNSKIIDTIEGFGYQVFDIHLRKLQNQILPENIFCIHPDYKKHILNL